VWKPPEEFAAKYEASLRPEPKDMGEEGGRVSGYGNEPLRGVEAHWKQAETPLSSSHQPLHAILPFRGPEPYLGALPHILYDGVAVRASDLPAQAARYAQEFRDTQGGCATGELERKPTIIPGKVGDLFCADGDTRSKPKQ